MRLRSGPTQIRAAGFDSHLAKSTKRAITTQPGVAVFCFHRAAQTSAAARIGWAESKRGNPAVMWAAPVRSWGEFDQHKLQQRKKQKKQTSSGHEWMSGGMNATGILQQQQQLHSESSRIQFYSQSWPGTPYNFPLFGLLFPAPQVRNSLYSFHSGFELATAAPYVRHLGAVYIFFFPSLLEG